jgi:hypothetical protein
MQHIRGGTLVHGIDGAMHTADLRRGFEMRSIIVIMRRSTAEFQTCAMVRTGKPGGK